MLFPENKLTIEDHNSLNPTIWQNDKLRPEVKDKLIDVAQAFLESIEIDVDVEDITFTGSLANFNYTPYSDIDLHILTDLDSYKYDKEVLKDYFKAKKTVWNSSHEIKIKGFDVEVYIQDINEEHHSTGVYSIKNDDWLVHPSKSKPVDRHAIMAKVKTMKDAIEHALSDNCDLECAEIAKEKILKARAAGLERAGEFSVENLAFKELRRSGDIDRLIKGVIEKKDKELSLSQETFKNFFGMPGILAKKDGSRGKRHHGVKAGVSKMTNPDNVKSLSMVAKSHSEMETPFIEIENLKKKPKGKTYLLPHTAKAIAYFYGMNMEKVNVNPRGLSTSGIVLGWDPSVRKYYLHKQ